MTPHKRSAQSLGRNGLPLLVTPWIKNSREAVWAEVSGSVMYAACLGSQGLMASDAMIPRASCGRGGACQRANPTRPDECNAEYALKPHQGRITTPASACHSDLLRFISFDAVKLRLTPLRNGKHPLFFDIISYRRLVLIDSFIRISCNCVVWWRFAKIVFNIRNLPAFKAGCWQRGGGGR